MVLGFDAIGSELKLGSDKFIAEEVQVLIIIKLRRSVKAEPDYFFAYRDNRNNHYRTSILMKYQILDKYMYSKPALQAAANILLSNV